MISNGLFEETNEQYILSKVFYNELYSKFPVYNLKCKILQWNISDYKKYVIITKQKVIILRFCLCNKLHA